MTSTTKATSHRHFLQSHEWAAFHKALGHVVFEREGKGWSYVAILERARSLPGVPNVRLYAPYGPSYTTAASLQAALDDMKAQAAEHGCTYLRIEPVARGAKSHLDSIPGLIHQSRPSQPALTLLIDLARDFDDVLADCSKTNRYLWRKIEKLGLSFESTHDPDRIDLFDDMMHATSLRTGAILHTGGYLRTLLETLGPDNVAGVYYAIHEGDPVAGVFFIDDFVAKTRYYMYAASFDSARQLNAMAPMVLSLIDDAQRCGMTTYDFFGVSPAEDTTNKHAGFSQFKRSFGGYARAYEGTYELPIKTVQYAMLQRVRQAQRLRARR